MSENKKILVVEDNDFVRLQVVNYLSSLDGFGVVEASGADEAMDYLDGEFVLGVVDLRMEPIGGFEFIRTLRSMGKEFPVVIITGDNSQDLLSEARRCGAGAVLVKPVQKERLLMTAEKLIAQASKRGG